MWEYVLEKYMLPDDAKDWVIKSIGASWRGYKSRLKKKHFYLFKDNKTRWKNRPKSLPDLHFQQLLNSWNKKDVMKQCLLKKNVRTSKKNMHTAGPKSFARIRAEMTNDDPNKEPPSSAQMFERTRKRTNGNVYLDTYDDTAKKIEQMKNYKPPEDGSAIVDPFVAVMSKKYDGHCRLYGKGVTNKLIKKVNGGGTSCMVPGDLMESLKASVEEDKKQLESLKASVEEDKKHLELLRASIENDKKQLLDMRREFEEDHEKKKAELEAIRNDILKHTQRKPARALT